MAKQTQWSATAKQHQYDGGSSKCPGPRGSSSLHEARFVSSGAVRQPLRARLFMSAKNLLNSSLEGRFDYAAIGTVSNVASRLCDEAKPRQILISPRVLMAVENAISVEPVGEFKLKGISRPLAANNVLSAVPSKI